MTTKPSINITVCKPSSAEAAKLVSMLEQFLSDQRLHGIFGGLRGSEVIRVDRPAVLRGEILYLAHRDRLAVDARYHAIHRRRVRYHHLVRSLLLFYRSRRRWLRLFFLREDRRER